MFRSLAKLLFHIFIHEFLALLPRTAKGGTHTHNEGTSHNKKNIIYGIWGIATLLMLTHPALPIILIIALPTTFLSFVILDENTS